MAASPEQSTEDIAEARAARRRTARFVGIFVVSVLVLLTGYRYSVRAPLNDWYLFQVAGHTAWALDKIGDRAELENKLRSAENPQRVRADLAAWAQHLDAPSEAMEAEASDAPLSAWERFQHRLQRTRRENPNASVGPRVQFIWRFGAEDEMADLEAQIADGDASPAERAALEARLSALKAQAAPGNAEVKSARRLMFNFIVIPECGAIEVMSIFFAAVLAFPAPWWKRLIGILVGVPVMYAVNIFRLSCLAVIGALDQGGPWFNFAHEYVWQTVYIVFVVMGWLAWVEYVVRVRRDEDGEEATDDKAAS